MLEDKLAFVIPALNEDGTVGRVVEEALCVCPTVLVVDDGSQDGTADVARRAGAHVVSTGSNRGQGHAISSGLQELRNRGFEYLCTIDADGAHDPKDALSLLAVHRRRQADVTIGSRFPRTVGRRGLPSAKRDANSLATNLVNQVLKTNLTDVASGMRVLGPRAVAMSVDTEDFSFAFEFIKAALLMPLAVTEGLITVRYNAEKLLCTDRSELKNLLSFCLRHSEPTENRGFGKAMSYIDEFRKVRLAVSSSKTQYVLLPIEEEDGYLIQRQNPWFVDAAELRTEGFWVHL